MGGREEQKILSGAQLDTLKAFSGWALGKDKTLPRARQMFG